MLLYWGSSYISNGSHTFSNSKFKDILRTSRGLLNIFQWPFLCVLKKWFEDYKNKLRPEGMKNGNFGVFTKVELAMSSHSYEQPTCYGRPLGHPPKWHYVYKCTSYEQPPAFKGHFCCVARVAAYSRLYCTHNISEITISWKIWIIGLNCLSIFVFWLILIK